MDDAQHGSALSWIGDPAIMELLPKLLGTIEQALYGGMLRCIQVARPAGIEPATSRIESRSSAN
jgi:hypothetical protein